MAEVCSFSGCNEPATGEFDVGAPIPGLLCAEHGEPFAPIPEEDWEEPTPAPIEHQRIEAAARAGARAMAHLNKLRVQAPGHQRRLDEARDQLAECLDELQAFEVEQDVWDADEPRPPEKTLDTLREIVRRWEGGDRG